MLRLPIGFGERVGWARSARWFLRGGRGSFSLPAGALWPVPWSSASGGVGARTTWRRTICRLFYWEPDYCGSGGLALMEAARAGRMRPRLAPSRSPISQPYPQRWHGWRRNGNIAASRPFLVLRAGRLLAWRPRPPVRVLSAHWQRFFWGLPQGYAHTWQLFGRGRSAMMTRLTSWELTVSAGFWVCSASVCLRATDISAYSSWR